MIAIKPHHFVDIITRLGDDDAQFQPHPYGHALHSVARSILEDHDILLCIELGCDTICGPCQHHVAGVCDDTIDISFRPQAPSSKQEYNLLIDQRWCERLGIEQNDLVTAREFCELLRTCSGNIEDIYRETPANRTQVRQARLARGIVQFLGIGPH